MNRLAPQKKLRLVPVIGWVLAAWLMAAGSSFAYTLVSSNQLVFVNVDHAAVGAYSTLAYGTIGNQCGLGTSSASIPFGSGGGGVVIVLAGSNGLQALPFVNLTANIASNATFFASNNVKRTLTPCTDQWNINGGALTLTHYTPAWNMATLSNATVTEQRRFFLPATWMVFAISNTSGAAEDFYFGLPASATQKSYSGGAWQGFGVGEAALAVPAGSCDLLSGASLTAALSGMTVGFAFHLNVPAGQTKTLTVVVAFYRSAVADTRVSASYYYTSLYPSMDSVFDAAFAGFADAQARCAQLATAMNNAGLNAYRHFLASDALHSYMADTECLIDASNRVYWRELEGAYNNINTFDLTVDHVYYDSYMHPWALRNVLDTYSGAINGTGYTFTHPLYNATNGAVVSTNGFSFHHDMGTGLNSDPPAMDPTAYESSFSYMGQEELQNWIECAGMYWSHSGDDAWLTNNATLLQACLNSMLLRDDTNAATRDGVTTYINKRGTVPENTTYDSLDPSLQSPRLNGMTAVKNWAAYLALQAMFNRIGDTADAATAQNGAAACAQSITTAWNTYHVSLGYIPAFLDGSNTGAIIPMVEGLAVPLQMGLTNAVDRTGGPYAAMLQALSNHLTAVLVSGRCLDATSGGWKLSSSSVNTWESKTYLCQYVAEKVLGITNNNVDGAIDQIHATFQMTEAPYEGWSDQLQSTGSGAALGSLHYPRGVTSALWWLSASNNPVYPPAYFLPTTLSGGTVTVSWPTNYTGWILQTNFTGLNNSAAWGDVPGSGTNTQSSWLVNSPGIPSGYFRLRHP
jgi:xylan 1,4-beta-xylosidase